jgi:hypothetical protein
MKAWWQRVAGRRRGWPAGRRFALRERTPQPLPSFDARVRQTFTPSTNARSVPARVEAKRGTAARFERACLLPFGPMSTRPV